MKSFKTFLLIFVVAGSANAADTTTTKFISLDACKTYYASSVTATSGQTADAYCADKIMTLTEACTATKISEYVTANKLKAFTDLTNTEQVNLKSKFGYQCQLTAQQEAAKAAQTAAATKTTSSSSATTAAVAAAAVAGTAAAVTAANNASKTANIQMASQLAQQGAKIADNIDKSQAAAAKAAAGADKASPTTGGVAKAVDDSLKAADKQIVQENAARSTASTTSAATPASNIASDGAEVTTFSDGTKMAVKTYSDGSKVSSTLNDDGTATVKTYGDDGTLTKTQELTKEQADTMVKEGQFANSQLNSAGSTVAKATPELADEVKKVEGSDAAGASVPATEITSTAKAATSEMETKVNSAIASSAQMKVVGLAPPFSQANAILSKYQAKVKNYYPQKESCSAAAERASFLCLEQTSPGQIAAKELMNAAGPILSIISSAQKTCSKTADITRLANLGLTIAKGVCVAAKVACDVSCAKSSVDIKTISAEFATEYNTAVNADRATAQARCASYASAIATAELVPECQQELLMKFQASQTVGTQMQTAFNTENSPKPGTSPKLAATCTSMAKDIALLAVQVLGTYAAQKNAQSCADKLAASGTAAANVTTQQYCEKSENVSSQLCVCQKNSMAAGCPGAVVASTKTADSNNETGTNIKSAGGNAAFAGGFGNGVKAPGFGVGKLGTGSNASGFAIGGSGDSSAAADSSGSGGGSGMGGAGGGLGGAPGSDPSNPTAKKDAEEKKKWGFGSFGGMASGIFGGSGSSSGSGVKGASGALTAKDKAGIQRQIASEKVSAEVSTASGKSNWEKIRNMYMLKESSFILGQ